MNAKNCIRSLLLAGAATIALGVMAAATSAQAQESSKAYSIASQDLGAGLRAFALASGKDVVFDPALVRGKTTHGVSGDLASDAALAQLLAGSGLSFTRTEAGGYVVRRGGREGAVHTDGNPATAVSEVVVTGTHIRNADPLSPLTVLSSTTLTKQGYTRLDDALAQLPQNFGSGVLGGADGGYNSNYASDIDLRGLGTGTTLVLINGQRAPLSVTGTSVDISAIPVSAIDRVEILTDGASATYGSDAIGGVVNIITKTNFDGFETSARLTNIADGKTPNYGGYVLGGFNWATGSALLNVDSEVDNPLVNSARSWSAFQPSPTYLLPKGQTTSVYGSVRQDLLTNLEAHLDILYSHRTYYYESNDDIYGAGEGTDGGYSDSLGVTGNLDWKISSSWHAQLYGAYGITREADNGVFDFAPTGSAVRYDVPSAGLRLDGGFFHLPGGAAKVAFGVEARKENFQADNDVTVAHAPRTVHSIYGELLVPIVGSSNAVPFVQGLEFDAAVRSDHYSDFGGTTNPKIAGKWTVDPDLSLHASYGTSFRAPTLISEYQQTFGYFYQVTNPAYPGGLEPALLIDGGNPDLRPETAKTYNAGLTFTPHIVPGLKVTLDYFKIDYRDKILRLITQGFLANVVEDASQLGSLVNLNPTPAQIAAAEARVTPGQLYNYYPGPVAVDAIADIGFVNVGSTQVQGFDLDASYAFTVGRGKLSMDLDATDYTQYLQHITPGSSAFSTVNTTYNPPRFRTKANVDWTVGGLDLHGRLNYTNPYKNTLGPPDCTAAAPCGVDAWTTVDLGVAYIFARDDAAVWRRGVRISVDVVNAFDAAPPIVNLDNPLLNYDSNNANPLGRAFAVTVTKRW